MGTILTGHTDEKVDLDQNQKKTVSDNLVFPFTNHHHIVGRKVSLVSPRSRLFHDFSRKSQRSISILKLSDPSLRIEDFSVQFAKLEKNLSNFKSLKQLEISWWVNIENSENDEVKFDENYYDDIEDEQWDEFQDDIDFEDNQYSLVQKKNTFSFLNRCLKQMKELKKLKVEAFANVNNYLVALKGNIKHLKNIKEITISISEEEIIKKSILNLIKTLKDARNLEKLTINFHWCDFLDQSIVLFLKFLPKMKRLRHLKIDFSSSMGLEQNSFDFLSKLPNCLLELETLVLNLASQDISDMCVRNLFQSISKHTKLKNYEIVLVYCPQISFFTKIKLCRKNGFFVFNNP